MSKKTGIASIATIADHDVGGYHLECTQFDVMRSLRMMAQIAPIAMPVIGQFAQFMEPDGVGGLKMMKFSDIETTKLAVPMATIFARVGVDEIQKLARDLLEDTRVADKDEKGGTIMRQLNTDADIIMVFGADLKGLLMAMGFSLKVNFAGFFSGSGAPAKPATTTSKT